MLSKISEDFLSGVYFTCRACSMYVGSRGAYRVPVGKSEERRPLERPRRRLEDNIKMNIIKVGWGHGLDRSGSG